VSDLKEEESFESLGVLLAFISLMILDICPAVVTATSPDEA
jgi:hypothetical protein